MTDVIYKGRGNRLDDVDLPRIGSAIGCGEDELHTFMEVEAAGSGFDKTGRVKILFEPHIFYRLLGPGKGRDKAVREGLAYKAWNRRGYKVDSYTRLEAAMKIDREVALKSASWGLGQVMGFNHKMAGYATVTDMVRAFADDEENHLKAMVAFLVNSKLDDNLRAHDWRGVENGYNGGGYNGAYAVKMARSFAKWQKIKGTPYDPKIHGRWTYKTGSTIAPTAIEALPQPKTENAVLTHPVSGKAPEKGGNPVSSSGAVGAAVVVGAATAAQQSGLDWKIIGGVIAVALILGVVLFKRSRT